jgi:hypothetical protein
MAEGFQHDDAALSAFMAPGVAISMWNPFLAGALEGNSHAFNEWQSFVTRRLREDVALLQRLSRSNAPDQVLAAYADFWRKAGEDYGNEITTMTRLMADITNKVAVAAHSSAEEANRSLPERQAA